MKANELRIGNYVNVPNKKQSSFRIDAFENLSNKFIKVAMIHPECGENFHPLTWYGDDLTPIPLTEDWLLKFNAIKLSDNIFSYSRFKFIWKKEYNYWYVVDLFEQTYLTKINFVHEFQNFIYILDGKELILKTK